MLRPIRTTETVRMVCTFDECVELIPGVANDSPQWLFYDAPEIQAVHPDASVALVHLLNAEECDTWRAKLAQDSDGAIVARELAKLKCDAIDGPGARSVAELPQLAQSSLGVAILRQSIYVEDPRKATCSV